MPWYNYYPRRRRPWRRFWRRPRNRFRRRYYRRRRWVRRRYRKKLKKIKLTQYQPACIRKCKITGPICLFQTTNQRLENDFDLYELSEVPETLPGGGGWGIKAYSLEALFSEHQYARNVWTTTNKNLPLVRYMGCRLRFYQSDYVDYCVTVSNQLPLISSLGMYNAMQPSIHQMLPNAITIPSTKTYKRKKPYKQIWVGPPSQLENKWYFQQNIARTPLLMTRVSSMSIQNFYIHPNNINTNMTIHTLNTALFQNRQFKDTTDYHVKGTGTSKVYLYASTQINTSTGLIKKNLIPLTNTVIFKTGTDQEHSGVDKEKWKTDYIKFTGNPFHPDYLQKNVKVYQIQKTPQQIFQNFDAPEMSFTEVEITKSIRYNPYSDQGNTNQCYFKSNSKDEFNWLPPDNPELTNEGLPFWLLLWGFTDWHQKIKKHLHLQTDYILTLTHIPTAINKEFLVPLSETFMNGYSPYQNEGPPNTADAQSWYPQLQYQNEIINNICASGPGVAKLHDNYSAQALMRYKFYFKWGGSPPPMSTVRDPIQQPTFVIPGNTSTTNSLQNPETDPASLLWSFDERRQQVTPKAIERIQKDTKLETTFIAGGSHFQEPIAYQQETTQETSSEEEEEASLFEQLNRQRLKQQRIKQRILATLKKLQNLE
nr:MAG: ORF1 [TTV-like mini virus]